MSPEVCRCRNKNNNNSSAPINDPFGPSQRRTWQRRPGNRAKQFGSRAGLRSDVRGSQVVRPVTFRAAIVRQSGRSWQHSYAESLIWHGRGTSKHLADRMLTSNFSSSPYAHAHFRRSREEKKLLASDSCIIFLRILIWIIGAVVMVGGEEGVIFLVPLPTFLFFSYRRSSVTGFVIIRETSLPHRPVYRNTLWRLLCFHIPLLVNCLGSFIIKHSTAQNGPSPTRCCCCCFRHNGYFRTCFCLYSRKSAVPLFCFLQLWRTSGLMPDCHQTKHVDI